jgi:hypothetical protein
MTVQAKHHRRSWRVAAVFRQGRKLQYRNDGFLGDQAIRRAFPDIVEKWPRASQRSGGDAVTNYQKGVWAGWRLAPGRGTHASQTESGCACETCQEWNAGEKRRWLAVAMLAINFGPKW